MNKHKGSSFEDYMNEPCGLTKKELSEAVEEADLRGEKRGMERAAGIVGKWERADAWNKELVDYCNTMAYKIRQAAKEIGEGEE